jgi:hypothetical protein
VVSRGNVAEPHEEERLTRSGRIASLFEVVRSVWAEVRDRWGDGGWRAERGAFRGRWAGQGKLPS